jgi:hypothetical protein
MYSELYAVVVTSLEAKSTSGTVITPAGTQFIATIEPDGWVPATSSRYTGAIPADAKTFDTEEAAVNFAKSWNGHPWWCRPNGEYEVIQVTTATKSVVCDHQREQATTTSQDKVVLTGSTDLLDRLTEELHKLDTGLMVISVSVSITGGGK